MADSRDWRKVMILFPVKSFSDGLRAGSNLFVNKVKFFLHGVGGCADSANILIKNACRNLQPLIDLLNHIALQNWASWPESTTTSGARMFTAMPRASPRILAKSSMSFTESGCS